MTIGRPPVYLAVRTLCIINLIGLFLHTGNTGWSVTSNDCCLAITKETTVISTVIGGVGKRTSGRISMFVRDEGVKLPI